MGLKQNTFARWERWLLIALLVANIASCNAANDARTDAETAVRNANYAVGRLSGVIDRLDRHEIY
jgi:hypothetical protein